LQQLKLYPHGLPFVPVFGLGADVVLRVGGVDLLVAIAGGDCEGDSAGGVGVSKTVAVAVAVGADSAAVPPAPSFAAVLITRLSQPDATSPAAASLIALGPMLGFDVAQKNRGTGAHTTQIRNCQPK